MNGVGGDNGGGHDASEGSADVGPKGEWEHVLEVDETHGRERGEGGGCDGGGLHHDGDEQPICVEVPVEADHLAEMRAAVPLTMIWSMYTMQKRQEQSEEGNDGRKVPAPRRSCPIIEEEAALEEALVAEASLDLGAAHLVAGAGGGSPRRCW